MVSRERCGMPSPKPRDPMLCAPQTHDLVAAARQTPRGLSLNWDLSTLRVDAKIDWISIVLRLAWRSQQQHVRNLLVGQFGESTHVLALSESEGSEPTENPNATTNSFRVRIQDPRSAAWTLEALNKAIKDKQSPFCAADVGIDAIEVSIDVRLKDGLSTTGQLAELVADLCTYRGSIPAQDGGLRAAASQSAGVRSGILLYREDILRAATDQVTFHSGQLENGFEQRIYLKMYDSRSGGEAHAPLPPEEHCARFEATLSGEHLPFRTLDEWRTFKFESLRKKYFTWRIIETEPPIAPADSRQIVFRLSRAKPGPSRRKSLAGTRVDQDFIQLAKNALERLTRAQSRAGTAPAGTKNRASVPAARCVSHRESLRRAPKS